MKDAVRVLTIALVAVSFAAPVTAQDADVSGEWTLSFDSPEVGPVSVNLLLAQDGAEFDGAGEVMGYGLEVSDGVVEGDELTFLIHIDVDGQFFTLEIDAETDGQEMTGTVTAEGMSAEFTGAKKENG